MIDLDKRLNRDIMMSWTVIVALVFGAYFIEVLKGTRTPAYVAVFMLVCIIPLLYCHYRYRKAPDDKRLKYFLLTGFFIMYIFCMATSHTHLVYTYIIPLLSMLVLYHDPGLIIRCGIVTMLINFIFVGIRIAREGVTIEDTRDIEIQLIILALTFVGCWMAAVIYDEINRQNNDYIEKIDEKSRQIQRMTFQTIETIANTIDAKDNYTKGHSHRVSEYSAEIARELGKDEEEIERIRYIALLHDIGKIGVPDAVLNKPGRLLDTEYELMKKHTTIGGEILKDVGMMPELDVGAKFHHERYDGKGYPNGLKGEEIPLVARIICMADSYDAMTSNRIYRKHLTHQVVIEEIKRCRGQQFDPDVTDAFLSYLERLDRSAFDEPQDEEMEYSNRLLNKVMEDQSKQLAENQQKDQLTKVYNRSAGERYITLAMRDSTGYMFYLNIDDMRRINREFGVRTGDFCLMQIVDLLQCLDANVVVSRFGGDEFLCYVPGITDQDEISKQMEQLLEGVRYVAFDAGTVGMTASIGISVHDDRQQSFTDALAEADKALYYLKQSGKDSYYFYRQVAGLEEDLSKQELSNLVSTIRAKDNFSDSMVLGQQDFFRMYEFVTDVVSDRKKDVELVMFTLRMGEGSAITVEQRDHAMDLADKALLETIHDKDAICTYSSTQRIAIFVDEDESRIRKIAGDAVKTFYKMYGQHGRSEVLTLEYHIASIKDKEEEK